LHVRTLKLLEAEQHAVRQSLLPRAPVHAQDLKLPSRVGSSYVSGLVMHCGLSFS